MITAIVLIKATATELPRTAQRLLRVPEVTELYSTTGDHDLIAVLRVADAAHLPGVVTDRIGGTQGVEATTTCVAFPAYPHDEVEAAFGLGLGGTTRHRSA